VFRVRVGLGHHPLVFRPHAGSMRDQTVKAVIQGDTPRRCRMALFLRRLGVWRSGIEGDPLKDATKEGRPLYRASSPIVNLVPCSSRCEP